MTALTQLIYWTRNVHRGLSRYVVLDECNELNQCKWPSSSSTYSMKILWWRCTVHWSIMRFLSFYMIFFFEKYFTKKYNNYMYMCKLSAKIFFTRIVAITHSWQSCLKLPSRKFEDSIMKKEYRHQLPQIRKPSDSSVYYQSATDFLLEMSHTK